MKHATLAKDKFWKKNQLEKNRTRLFLVDNRALTNAKNTVEKTGRRISLSNKRRIYASV